MTHILVDTANTFFRARHVIRGDTSEKIGMAIHITMNSIKKAWQDFEGSHLIFCLEGRSWRKDHYAPYKRNRRETLDAMTPKEKEENEVFWECYDDFVDFIKTKTNATVLQNMSNSANRCFLFTSTVFFTGSRLSFQGLLQMETNESLQQV